MKSKINHTPATLFFLFLLPQLLCAQERPDQPIAPILQNYEHYREPAIRNRLFKHSDVLPLIRKHVNNNLLQDEIIAQSSEGRSIHHLTAGRGKTRLLFWSQMHGDESTATMALFDLFNFLSANDRYNTFRKFLLDNLELNIVPMLNPDGAQIWTRRNAMNIDLNRDAENLATPEARALMAMGKKLNPQFGFNLHDQSTLYAAGKNTAEPATISFLAPAFNDAKDMNEVRSKAVRLIVSINNAIRPMIPDKIGKYDDTHDSSCFGDTFQAMGISTILIESGGYPGDPEKQYLRKVNFYALLTALNAIATESYLNEDPGTYWSLPNNQRNLHDLIIRNVPANAQAPRISIGIDRVQSLSADLRSMNYSGTIVRPAGLESAYAYKEVDAAGMEYSPGKIISMTQGKWDKLRPSKELRLIKKGYLFVKWNDGPSPAGPVKNRLLNLTNAEAPVQSIFSGPANFILTKDQKPLYAVINGFLVDLSDKAKPLPNTMGYNAP